MIFPPPSAPMIPVAAAFALGIAAAILIGLPGALIIAGGLTVICLVLKKRYIVVLGVIMASGTCQWFLNEPRDNIKRSEYQVYSGTVVNIKDVVSSRIVTLRIDSACYSPISATKADIIIPSYNPEIHVGDRIGFGGSLTPIEVQTDLPDEISASEFSLKKGILRSGVVLTDSIHYVIEESGILNDIRRWNLKLTDCLMGSNLSDPSKDFFAAILLGDDTLLNRDLKDVLSTAGLAHIIALSGLHVAVIAFFAGIILLPLRLIRSRWIFAMALVISFWLFAIMTGMAASVIRSTIMASVLALGVVLQRKTVPANSLALAAFVILLFKPSELIEPGFQMSFASVAGILMFYNHLCFGENGCRIVRGIGSLTALSLSAVLGSSICVAFYFHSVPLMFLPDNILVVPILLPLAMGTGVISLVISATDHDLPSWLAMTADAITDLINRVAALVSQMPYGVLDTGELGAGAVLSGVTLLLLFRLWLQKKKHIWLGCIGLMLICLFVSCEELSLPKTGTEIYFVNQNSRSTEIVLRADRQLLVMSSALDGDTAKIAESMRIRYGRYMRRRGIKELRMIPRQYESKEVVRNGAYMNARGINLVVIGRNSEDVIERFKGVPLNYVVIEPTFRGDKADMAARMRCDSIIDLKEKREEQRRVER